MRQQQHQRFSQYEALMAELERESWGDFVGFMRLDPEMFHELLMRLTPRLTKATLQAGTEARSQASRDLAFHGHW